jgi:ribose-phosphate pyrophosphokinase
MSSGDGLSIFALGGSADYGRRVAAWLEVPLDPLEEREFEDGEHKARPLAEVRRRDVFVIHSLYGDAQQSGNDKLCRLLFFIGALKEAGAERVTAIVPYLCYARKDRQTKPRDPVTTKYVACLFEAVGADGVVTIDVHNLAAFQNAFRCRTDHLEARSLFVDHFTPLLQGEDVAVVSPDVGGTKRAEEFRRVLAERLGSEPVPAFMEKRRSGGIVSGDVLVGDVRGRSAIIIDDLVSTGTTLKRAAHACREAGASHVHAVVTHGLFIGGAAEIVADPLIDSFVVTDTVPPFRLAGTPALGKVTVLDSTRLVADAIVDNRFAR